MPDGADSKPAPSGPRRGPAKGSRRRVFEEVRDRIRDQILSGELKEGDKLPAERDLEGRLGFSRVAVREAFRALESEGFLELRKGVRGGAFIRKPDGRAVTRSMTDVFLLGQIPLGEITEVRLILLPQAAMLACARATEADLATLAANIENTELAIASGQDLAVHVAQFYRILGAATKNDMFSMMIDATTDVIISAFSTSNLPYTTDFLEKRKGVLEALRARDAEGLMTAIVDQILHTHARLAAALRGGQSAESQIRIDHSGLLGDGLTDAADLARRARPIPAVEGALSAVEAQRLREENSRLKALVDDLQSRADGEPQGVRA